jgi:TetR/AcrR family transcriptional repressor of nem operon
MRRTKTFDEDRVVDAAADCFWAHSYGSTLVRDLGATMGINAASLYNAYGDKRELFLLSLERCANRSMRERIARIEVRYQPMEAIGAFLGEIVDLSAKDPECEGCLLVNSALDVASRVSELENAMPSYLGENRNFFRRGLEAPCRAGAKRQVLENVARPALELLRKRVRRPRRKSS